jgi:hypothetical protein
MAIRAASTRRSQAASAQSGETVAIYNGTGVTVAGAVVSSSTQISLGTTVVGQTSAQSTTTASGGSSGPIIGNVQYLSANNTPISGDVAVSTLGGNVLINGSNFVANSSVYVNNALVSNTFVSSTQIIATVPANTGNVSLFIFSPTNVGTVGPNIRYDVVPVWTTSAISLINGVSANITLSVTSDSTLTYTLYSGSLPTGMSLSSTGYISGTATGYNVTSATTAVLVATNQAGQATQQTINFTILIGDTYWSYDSTLIGAGTNFGANTFITDNSTSNNHLTVVGATKAQNFNPYQLGYYSVGFGGSDYLTMSASPPLMGTGFAGNQITIEGWIYPTVYTSSNSYGMGIIGNYAGVAANGRWAIVLVGSATSSGTLQITYTTGTGSQNNVLSTKSFNYLNSWNHIAVTINATTSASTTINFFVNGVLTDNFTGQNLSTQTSYYSAPIIGGNLSSYINNYIGYMSNFRISSGLTYTSNFSVPTTPLLTNSSTAFLGLQSNRFIDISPANTGLTISGVPTVQSTNPFATAYQAGAPYYSTYFNGSSDYLSIAGSSSFAFGTGDFTVECWINLTVSSATDQAAFSTAGASTVQNNGVSLGLYNNIPRAFIGNGTGTGDITLNGTVSLLNAGWTHIACVRHGGTFTYYVNGISVASATDSHNLTATNTVLIGSVYTDLSRYFGGEISNLRVVAGTALYTANFTPSTALLTAVANTVLLTCQNSTFVDNSTNAFSITPATTTVKPVAVSPFTPSSYTSNQITNFGSGLLNGSTDYLTSSYPINWSTYGSYTLEFWVYHTAVSATNQTYASTGSTGYTNFYSYGSGATNPNSIAVGIQGTNEIRTANNVITANQWYHIAFTYNGTTTVIYLNGVQVASATTAVYPNNSGNLVIGTGLSSQPVAGYMSDFRLTKSVVYTSNFVPPINSYNTALANTQLLTLQSNGPANNNGIIDQSNFTSNNVITRTGTPTSASFSPYGDNWSVLQSYGPNGYYKLTTNANYDITGANFTVECWVNFKSWSTVATSPQGIVGNYGGSTGWIFGFTNAINSPLQQPLSFLAYGTTSTAVYSTGIATGTNISLGQWNHLAVMQSSGTIYFFLNGVMTYSTTAPVAVGAGSSLYTTYASNSTANHSIYISNLRIVKGVAVYSTSGFTPPTAPLTAIPGTTLLICQSNRHIDNSPINGTIAVQNGSGGVQPLITNFSPFSNYTLPKYYSTAFNGTTDYLSIANNSALNFGTNAYTIECWFYLTSLPATSAQYNFYAQGLHQSGTAFHEFCVFNNAGVYQINGNLYNGSSYVYQAAVTATGLTTYTWYHAAMIYNGTSATMSFNGTLGTPATGTGTTPTTTVWIGYGNGTGLTSPPRYFPGYISNLRILNGTALYTTNFTPPTAPLTAIPNTVLLTCQNSTFVDNSVNNFTVTSATATVKPWMVSPFTPAVNTIASYTPAQFGSSVYFNGSTDYLTLSAPPATALGSGNWTIDGWFYSQNWNITSGAILFDFRPSGTNGYYPELGFTTSGGPVVYVNGANLITGSTNLYINEWYHFAIVKLNNVTTLYINGVSNGSASDTNTYAVGANAPVIGGSGFGRGGQYFTGYIADFRVINGVGLYQTSFYPGSAPALPNLTGNVTLNGNLLALNSNLTANSTVTSSLMLNGTAGGIFDSTRITEFVTVGNPVITSNLVPYTPAAGLSSVYFTGASYLTANTTSVSTFANVNFTVETWWKSSGTQSQYAPLVSNYFTSSPVTGSWAFKISGSTANYLEFTYYNGSSLVNIDGTSNVNDGNWHHIAAVRNNNYILLFVDGTQQQNTAISNTQTIGVTTGNLLIGYEPRDNVYINGYITDLRITNGYARYVANFTPSIYQFPTK